MKKILFVINTLGGAGAETAMLELIKCLPKEEYQVSLYVLTGQGELIHRLPDYVKVLNTDYDDTSVLTGKGKSHLMKKALKALFSKWIFIKRSGYLIKNAIQLLKHKKFASDKLIWRVFADASPVFSEHYDLAVAYLEGGSTYYVADYVSADKKAAFVHVDYNQAGYNRSLDLECYQKFDKIFTVSDEVKEAFLKVYPQYAAKTEIFHNFLNPQEIKERAALEGGFTDDFDGIRILTVGRLTKQKAYEVSIEAMKLLKDMGKNLRWYVLGEGSERKVLEEKIRNLGLKEDFLLLGAVENPYPYFAQTDMYVHASRFEGKSIAIQEAQILGCAILVSDCSGNREQVEDGVDGKMCPLTPEAVRDGILWLLENEERRKKCAKEASKKYLNHKNEMDKLYSLFSK